MNRGYRSLFWPIFLIAVGIIWLLANLGIIPAQNFALLLNLWPLLLIIIGLNILFGRRSRIAGTLIGILAMVVIVGVLVFGPALGLRGSQPVVDVYREAVETTQSATFQLHLSSQPTRIYPGRNPDLLIDASIGHIGLLDYRSQGDVEKTISLESTSGPGDWLFWMMPNPVELNWEIGLTNKIPLRLEIDGASGQMDLGLTDLKLSGLSLDMASGACNLRLPSAATEYLVTIDGASGALAVTLPANTSLTVKVDGASGAMDFSLPAGSGVRVEVHDSGSGAVRLPANLARIQMGSDDEGVWESTDYATASAKILVIINDVGSGAINIR